jgi:hypothetical protein
VGLVVFVAIKRPLSASSFRGSINSAVDDRNLRANGDPVEELNNVAGTHTNAAVARVLTTSNRKPGYAGRVIGG